jgi:pilus assembly protein CpaE
MKLAELLPNQKSTLPKLAAFVAVVSDAGTRDVVTKLISDQAISHAHVATGTIEEAIQLVRQIESSPRLLIVDISASAMPLSDLTRLAQVCDPSVRVVAIGTQNDVGLFRNLLRLGVQDYFVKPVTVELLRRSLVSDEPVVQGRAGKVVSFIGTRGGVGVTTVAVCLARYLSSEARRRVAYVDLNLHGGAANSLLGLVTNNGLAELLQMAQRPDAAFVERMLVAKTDRLFVLSSEIPLGEDAALRTGALADLIDTLKRNFHYMLLDVSGCVGHLLEDALLLSNLSFIVADRSVHAARECARLIRFSEELGGERALSVVLNNPLEPVPGRVDMAEFEAAFGRLVTHELPYDPKALALAENLAEPLDDRKHQGFGQSIKRFAQGITNDEAEQVSPRHAWLKHLWRRP